MKHPLNKGLGKGAMNERFGWACLCFVSEDKAIYFEDKHGECEAFLTPPEQ